MTEFEAYELVLHIMADRERSGQPPPGILIDAHDDVAPDAADKIPRVWIQNPQTGEPEAIVSMAHYLGLRAKKSA